jgi:hypothetical protein
MTTYLESNDQWVRVDYLFGSLVGLRVTTDLELSANVQASQEERIVIVLLRQVAGFESQVRL